jgi:hypothetical protein
MRVVHLDHLAKTRPNMTAPQMRGFAAMAKTASRAPAVSSICPQSAPDGSGPSPQQLSPTRDLRTKIDRSIADFTAIVKALLSATAAPVTAPANESNRCGQLYWRQRLANTAPAQMRCSTTPGPLPQKPYSTQQGRQSSNKEKRDTLWWAPFASGCPHLSTHSFRLWRD